MVIPPETKEITAFHESGHAIVGFYSGGDEIVKATLIPRGDALGMVQQQPKDELLTTKEACLIMIDTCMGGRVAEELIFGSNKVTQGAGSDLEKATKIAQAMIMNYGMGDKLGKMAFSERDIHSISPNTQFLIEQEVRDILEQSYARAKVILMKHRDQLNLLANALLEYETLSLDEIKSLVCWAKFKRNYWTKEKRGIRIDF